jgi:hypothetical protein
MLETTAATSASREQDPDRLVGRADSVSGPKTYAIIIQGDNDRGKLISRSLVTANAASC